MNPLLFYYIYIVFYLRHANKQSYSRLLRTLSYNLKYENQMCAPLFFIYIFFLLQRKKSLMNAENIFDSIPPRNNTMYKYIKHVSGIIDSSMILFTRTTNHCNRNSRRLVKVASREWVVVWLHWRGQLSSRNIISLSPKKSAF